MQKALLITLFLVNSTFGFSQETEQVSVEKSVFGIQTGLFGLLQVHNELKLANQFVLRTELGLADISISRGDNTDLSFDTSPSITIEPRWYYNLDKRAKRGKRIDGNSGNFFSLRATYAFNRIKNLEKFNLNYPFLAPTWGIRRNIGKHFNYEAGVGAGLGFANDGNNKRKISFTPYLNLRIGYRF